MVMLALHERLQYNNATGSTEQTYSMVPLFLVLGTTHTCTHTMYLKVTCFPKHAL